MATFVLIPGAGGQAWYWHRVVPELEARGHTAVAVELPAEDPDAGLEAYTDVVVRAVEDLGPGPGPGRDRPLVLVAQSMGGLTAPLVCTRTPVDLLVLLAAMVPRPGESGGQWWEATGQEEARAAAAIAAGREVPSAPDPVADFLHDVPPEVLATGPGEPDQSERPFADPWPLPAWPDVPTRFVAPRDDRFFPPEFQRRVVAERLGIPVDEVPGGHLAALSRPVELAERLDAYVRELTA